MDLLKGMRVKVRAHTSEYPAFSGVLLDDANSSEGWDVVDVEREDGQVFSIYCFSIEREDPVEYEEDPGDTCG
jgi:hypothetical protein